MRGRWGAIRFRIPSPRLAAEMRGFLRLAGTKRTKELHNRLQKHLGILVIEIGSGQQVSTNHSPAASGLIAAQHQSRRFDRLLNEGQLALVQLEVHNLPWFHFPPGSLSRPPAETAPWASGELGATRLHNRSAARTSWPVGQLHSFGSADPSVPSSPVVAGTRGWTWANKSFVATPETVLPRTHRAISRFASASTAPSALRIDNARVQPTGYPALLPSAFPRPGSHRHW
jgi:hypothetical protein